VIDDKYARVALLCDRDRLIVIGGTAFLLALKAPRQLRGAK